MLTLRSGSPLAARAALTLPVAVPALAAGALGTADGALGAAADEPGSSGPLLSQPTVRRRAMKIDEATDRTR
jgi:hypothetical protein